MRTRDRLLVHCAAAVSIVALLASCSSGSNGKQESTTTSVAGRTSSSGTLRTTTTSPAATESLTCPKSAPEKTAPHQVPGTTTRLVPGSPNALLACRYHGLNQAQPAGSLATSAPLSPAATASELNHAQQMPKGAVFSCPKDSGEKVLLLFGFPTGSSLTASVSMSGCLLTTNGDQTVRTPVTTLRRLESTVGHDQG